MALKPPASSPISSFDVTLARMVKSPLPVCFTTSVMRVTGNGTPGNNGDNNAQRGADCSDD
jgi:hypothetical protein